MAVELIDFRTKITVETASVFDAISHATGKDRAEIAREVLAEGAAAELHKATVIVRVCSSEGTGAAATRRPVDSTG